jgi:hypothetical protein
MKITASVFDMRHIAHRPLCTTRIKLNPECAIANILKGRRRAVPAQAHALRRTLTIDCEGFVHASADTLPWAAVHLDGSD